jgi:hypothetical protein
VLADIIDTCGIGLSYLELNLPQMLLTVRFCPHTRPADRCMLEEYLLVGLGVISYGSSDPLGPDIH